MKKFLGKVDYRIILIIILSIISISLFSYYIYDLNKVEEEVKVKEVEKVEEPVEEVIPAYTNLLPEYRVNYNNNNIMGRIEIPSLIDTLVVRAGDNKYYLDRNLYNVYDGIGAPFFDYRNTDLENNKQINIYGHNTQNANILNKLPLATLTSYLDENVFKTYNDLYLYTDTEKILYEVVGVKVVSKSDNTHMNISFNSNKEFKNHANSLLTNTSIKKNIELDEDDNLLVLQTCNYNPSNSLVLVIFRKVKIVEKS